MNYLSSLQQVIRNEFFKGKIGIFADKDWYKDVRTLTTKQYTLAYKDMGLRLVNSPDPLTEDLLALICQSFLLKNSAEYEKNRAIVCMMWHLFGRVSEVGRLLTGSISYDYNHQCLTMDMNRTKGSGLNRVSNYGVFLHRTCWKQCPIHALGAHFILNPPSSNQDYVFESIQRERMSAYINSLLKSFKETADEEIKGLNLTSHSARHGAASKADSDPQVNISWIIERGEWVLERLNTVFEYIGGVSSNDRKVARSLSNWPTTHGGIPPNLDTVHITGIEEFSNRMGHLAKYLFPTTLPMKVKKLLLAVQLMYYKKVKEEFSDHPLVIEIEKAALAHQLTLVNLADLGKALQDQFKQSNFNAIPILHHDMDIVDALNTHGQTVADRVQELAEKTDVLEMLIQEKYNKFQETADVILSEIRSLSAGRSSGTNTTPAVQPGQVPQNEEVPVVSFSRLPSRFKSLKGISFQDAFIAYLQHGLADYKSGPGEENRMKIIRTNYKLCCDMDPRLKEIPGPTELVGDPLEEWKAGDLVRIEELLEEIQQRLDEWKKGSSKRKPGEDGNGPKPRALHTVNVTVKTAMPEILREPPEDQLI